MAFKNCGKSIANTRNAAKSPKDSAIQNRTYDKLSRWSKNVTAATDVLEGSTKFVKKFLGLIMAIVSAVMITSLLIKHEQPNIFQILAFCSQFTGINWLKIFQKKE